MGTVKRISSAYSGGFYEPTENDKIEKFKNDSTASNNRQKNGKNILTLYKRSKVLKDLDFMQDGEKLHVGDKLRKKYLLQLHKDLQFLIRMNVMDYSLLVGVHRLDIQKNKKKG